MGGAHHERMRLAANYSSCVLFSIFVFLFVFDSLEARALAELPRHSAREAIVAQV